MLSDLWAVAWFEYRRHLRSRVFWRRALGSTLLVLSITALLGWTLYYFTQLGNPARLYALLLQVMLSLQGLIGLVAPLFMTPRAFSDKTRRGETPDLYMTALHPLGIVLGRLLAVGLHSGLIFLMLLPAGVFICQLAGFPIYYWVLVMGMTWVVTMMWASLTARWLNKYFPDGLEGGMGSEIPLLMLAVLALAFVFTLFNSVVSLELSIPLLMMAPPRIPQEILRQYALGGWVLPAWLVMTPFIVGITVLSAVATAQWLGWWSDRVYRWQRWVSTLFYWLFCGVNLAVIATALVRSASQAEQAVFYGMIVGLGGYLLGFSQLTGYYGVGIRPRHMRFALPPPLGGMVWEWVMVVGVAFVMWVAVGISTGYWVAPLRWLSWTVCLLSIFMILQATHGVRLLKYLVFRDSPVSLGRGFHWRNLAERRVEVEQTLYEALFVPVVIGIFLIIIAPQGVFSVTPQSFFQWIVIELLKIVVLLLPFSGLSHFAHPLLHYWLYTVYSWMIVVLLYVFRYRKVRRQHTSSGAGGTSAVSV